SAASPWSYQPWVDGFVGSPKRFRGTPVTGTTTGGLAVAATMRNSDGVGTPPTRTSASTYIREVPATTVSEIRFRNRTPGNCRPTIRTPGAPESSLTRTPRPGT